jgi:small subunit ribosomal protein S16
VISDARSPRDGRFIEQIGTYDPMHKPSRFEVKKDRLDYWLGMGAKPTESLKRLVLTHCKEEQGSP